jgi:thiosulfate dehydrogenase
MAGMLAALLSPARAEDGPTIDIGSLPVPAVESLGDGEQNDLIRYGRQLFQSTYRFVGPEVGDPAMRYAGNNLSCANCHLDSGTRPYAMPMIGISRVFPAYRAREGKVNDLPQRIDGCMERSMNGRPIPHESREMKAFTAYLDFLGRNLPADIKITANTLKGARGPPLARLDRPAAPDRGREVFGNACAQCHGSDGQGVRNGAPGDAMGYKYPPLWGPDSFNDGAASARILTLARYVHANMPWGIARHDNPVLSVEDATDVAAFVDSQPRPHRDGLDADFPERWNKPVDAAFPPYVDGASAELHKYGPFPPLLENMKKLAPAPKP